VIPSEGEFVQSTLYGNITVKFPCTKTVHTHTHTHTHTHKSDSPLAGSKFWVFPEEMDNSSSGFSIVHILIWPQCLVWLVGAYLINKDGT
jgi:hypothetical protein